MLIARLQAAGLLLGPLIFAASPLFWIDGHYGITGGMLIALAMVPWVYGLIGEYERLRERVPTLAGLWLLLLIIGMLGSIAFGLQGFFEGVFDITERASLAALDGFPPQSLLVLWLPGPTFPLALLIFGLLIGWNRMSPRWVAILICVAAITFPLSRVFRVDWIAYIADLLMILPFGYLAWRAWRHPRVVSEPTSR
jgi:hypothetical protein